MPDTLELPKATTAAQSRTPKLKLAKLETPAARSVEPLRYVDYTPDEFRNILKSMGLKLEL